MGEIIKKAIEKLDNESNEMPAAKVFAEYLKNKIVSDIGLAQNIIKPDKSLKDMLEFVKSNAKKKAVNGVACIEDSTVFKWTENYFGIEKPVINDDDIDAATEAVSYTAKEKRISKVKKATEDNDNQISMLDMLGADL